ncbi:ABC transporter ATP-binding protein [Nonomuraea maritima]|uniref:ABC transporter ATP-binding protein n=1 Tax=Nonomuraea maritima TaxID=683260 RepID=UPI0037225793
MTALTIRGLTKRFGAVQALAGIDLDVPEQGITAILGPSGCGKTTLLRLIAGFASPDAGTIAFGASVVAGPGTAVPPQKRHIGYVPQEGALFPHLSVADNITFGLPRAMRRSGHRLAELLDLVELDRATARRHPHELSGGQQQRVALARALAPRPSIVLLDEPFSSLDASLRLSTGQAVAQALDAAGATGILVTHDQDEALSLAHQVAVMHEGRLVQVGAPGTVYGTPADPDVARFVGAAILLPAVVDGERATCALGTLATRPGAVQGRAHVLIRPEQIGILPDDASSGGVPAVAGAVSYFGHDATVELAVQPDRTRVTARVMGTRAPDPGTRVRLSVSGPVIVFPVDGS